MNLADCPMTPADLAAYVFRRKLHPDPAFRDAQRDGLRRITIHNAKTAEEVRLELRGLRQRYTEYRPPESEEPHFSVEERDGLHLHAVNYRGNIRLIRDLDQAHALEFLLGRDLDIATSHFGNDSYLASFRFDQKAAETAHALMRSVGSERIETQGGVVLLIGPHGALPGTDAESVTESEYLNHRVLDIDGKKVVHLDYIFADQAADILGKMYIALNAEAQGIGRQLTADIFHYGKIGLLSEGARGDVGVPTIAIDERHLASALDLKNRIADDSRIAGLFNRHLGTEARQGITVNTTSVLSQTRAGLEAARDAGARYIEMEWRIMAGLRDPILARCRGLADIRQYFAGVVSDRPLDGETLGSATYDPRSLAGVARAHIELIKEL